MDPVSLVLAALAAGVSAGVSGGATDAVKSAVTDAYGGLKTLVRKAFGSDEKAQSTLTLFEDDPTQQVLVTKLAGQLEAHGIAQSPEVLTAAQEVLDAAGPTVGSGGVVATVLQIHADRGGVAVAENLGTIIAGYREAGAAEPDPS
jgi:hypothetical protein